jgi:hypothetical protein
MNMNEPVSPPDTYSQGLLALARRLLNFRFPGMDTGEPQLLVGQLPPDLPIKLPVPPDATLLGSRLQGEQDVLVVLDVAQPAAEVFDFYRRELTVIGWQELPPLMPGGGLHPMPPQLIFCQGRRGPSLTVTAHEGGDNSRDTPTDIRLHLDTDPHRSPCALGGDIAVFGRSSLPALQPPAGAQVCAGEGGGGSQGDSQYSSVVLETTQSAAEIAASYHAQLRAAGWEATHEESNDTSARSTWRFQDEQGETWAGTLFVVDAAEQVDRRIVYLYAAWLS